jgi:peptidoglycan-associated lipoprotein
MKLNSFAKLLVLGLALATVATGCMKRPTPLSNIPGQPFGTPDMPNDQKSGLLDGTNGPGGFPLSSPEGHFSWGRNEEIFKANTVHFSFDSSSLAAKEKPNVQAVASYLKAHPADAVEVEGHCDERGTAEYNRALGDRRALSVREELIRLGVAPNRVDTISYGFDRLLDTARNEAAYAKNRRGEFVLLTPPAAGASTTVTPDTIPSH